MIEAWRDFLSTWKEWGEEHRELDDERVLVLIHVFSRGKTSGLELDQFGQLGRKGASLFHIRAGKVTRFVFYFDSEQALADLLNHRIEGAHHRDQCHGVELGSLVALLRFGERGSLAGGVDGGRDFRWAPGSPRRNPTRVSSRSSDNVSSCSPHIPSLRVRSAALMADHQSATMASLPRSRRGSRFASRSSCSANVGGSDFSPGVIRTILPEAVGSGPGTGLRSGMPRRDRRDPCRPPRVARCRYNVSR